MIDKQVFLLLNIESTPTVKFVLAEVWKSFDEGKKKFNQFLCGKTISHEIFQPIIQLKLLN